NFVFAALQDIYDSLISHQCNDRFIAENENQTLSPQNGVLSSSLICKNLIAKLVPILSKFDQCTCCDEYSGLRYCDLSKLLVKKPDDTYSWYCDIGVYTKNRSFRLYKSSKYKKEEKFVMVDENKWKPIGNDKEDRERQIFMASLVRYTGPIKGIIPAPMTSRHEQPHPNLILSNSHIRDSCTSNTFGPSPFREIDDFIKGLISKGPCVGSIRKWTLLEQSQTLIYEIANYRYCENVGQLLPKSKPYWLSKENLNVTQSRTSLVEIIQTKKALIKEPGFLKRWLFRRYSSKQNAFTEKDFINYGPDVYAAQKTVDLSGRFRIIGQERWIKKLSKPKGSISINFDFDLECVDLSMTNIDIDGLDNYVACSELKVMYLTKCMNVDDWFLARLANEFNGRLLMLDISSCPHVGVTGLLALTRLKSLKKLRAYDLRSFEDKELATFILEDSLPNCLIEGIDYGLDIEGYLSAPEETIKTDTKLSEHEQQLETKAVQI
ncbi:unnamed protein product, partial [Didymodactylos carnosus]